MELWKDLEFVSLTGKSMEVGRMELEQKRTAVAGFSYKKQDKCMWKIYGSTGQSMTQVGYIYLYKKIMLSFLVVLT